MDGASSKGAKFTVRSASVSCCLSCPRREWEEEKRRRRRRRIIPSAESFLFISHSWVTASSVHLPLALLSCLSPSPSSPSLYPSLSFSLPSLLPCSPSISLFLGASLVCSCTQMSATSCSLFTEHVGWNVCVCLCVCASALYLCNSVYPYVHVCEFIGVLSAICPRLHKCRNIDPHLHRTAYNALISVQLNVNYLKLLTKRDSSVKRYFPICESMSQPVS